MHFENSLTHLECQSWNANFKTEVRSKSATPQLTMQWITEVEMAKFVHDRMTSRSITRRTDFTVYDMLDAILASALKKLLTHVHFRKRVSVEQQRAHKYERFFRVRQIAYMIYKHIRATGAYEAVQTMFKTSIQDGTRLCHPQMKFLRKWSWKVYTSQSCRILFNFRLSWQCMNRRIFETTNSRAVPD